MSVSTLLAKALYDNMAESADELSFRRGEILMVVERDTVGLGGWWLCSLHGRRGIVPGNRLKLLEGGPREGRGAPPLLSAHEELGVYQVPPSLEGSKVYQAPPSLEGSKVYQAPPSLEGSKVYQVPPSLEGSKVYQVPQSLEASKVYQVPPSLERAKVYRVPPPCEESEVYQVPPSLERSKVKQVAPSLERSKVKQVAPSLEGSKVYRVPPSLEGSEVYQVPPSLEGSKIYQVPPLSEGSKVYGEPPSLEGSEVYQVPPSLEGSKVYRVPPSHEEPEVNRAPSSANRGHSEAVTHERKVSDVPDRETVSRSDSRLSADENEYTVPDSEIYKMPTVRGISESSAEEVYNTPTIAGWDPDHPPLRDIPPVPHRYDDTDGENPTGEQEVYSVPTLAGKQVSRSDETYDVPASLTRKVAKVSPSVAREPSSAEDLYDWPREPAGMSAAPSPAEWLSGLRLSVLGGSSRLMEAVSRGLGGRQWAEAESSGVRSAARSLGSSLREFLACCRGWDPQRPGLGPHLEGLEEALGLLGELGRRLEAWERGEAGAGRSLSGLQDLSQFAAVTGRIAGHVEGLASLLLGEAQPQPQPQAEAQAPLPLLGEAQPSSRRPLPPLPEPGGKAGIQTRPLPPTPAYVREEPGDGANVYEGVQLAEEHEYVRLQGKEIPDICQKEVLSTEKVTEITEQLKESQVGAPQDPVHDPLPATDRRLIAFYAQQSDAHFATLLGAIDALFSCLHASQPPRAFVGHGRYVIVSAHKLVFIGDALSRQARAPGVRAEVGRSGALLCQALKAAVLATKGAALRYPALPAVQDMVDKVTELSHHALRFTRLLGHMSLR